MKINAYESDGCGYLLDRICMFLPASQRVKYIRVVGNIQ